MIKDPRTPIWLDIETGGIDPSKSSILSIASGKGTDIRSVYSSPQAGTFLSSFSEQNIIPQLRGKSLLAEKVAIESLIQQLEVNPRAPLAGFNIRGFDIGFIQRRARTYGLEKRFTTAMKGREVLDPVYQVKDIVASAISRHADIGTFSTALEGKSWKEAELAWSALPFEKRPTEYNLIAQVKGYLKADRESAMFKGWKLEDLYKLLPEEGKLTGQAHEAATDIKMTQRVTQAARTGELEQELQKPARAFQWMETVKARGYHQFGPGRLLSQADVEGLGLALPRWWQTKPAKVAGLGLAAVLAASLFTGRDDEYNTIEGLPHGGFAQSGRLQLTEFGSGWKGGRQIFRAERLYKSAIRTLLKEQGYTGKISWLSNVDEAGELGLVARSESGEALMGIQRTFNKDTVDLTSIEVAKQFRGGLGRQFYETESRILKRLGFEGAEVTSPVANPVTGRMQAQLYGSKPMSLFARDIEEAYGTNLDEFQQMLMSKKMTKEQWEVTGLAPTFSGRVGKPTTRPIMSGKDDAHNTIEGLGHKGIGNRLRKLLTPFGSGWNSLRNLVQGTETFEQMLKSKGFQKALRSATQVGELGEGQFGKALHMKSTFRGQEFSFVRKVGDIQEQEALTMSKFSESFAPDVYRTGKQGKKGILDMEMFEGKPLYATENPAQHMSDLAQNVQSIHKAGYVHGDIHSGNVFITKEGKVGLIDWGASGKIGSDAGLVRKGKLVEVNEMGVRTPDYDWTALRSTASELTPGTSEVDEIIRSSQPGTAVARKKRAQASLQRSAAASSWAAGKNGGRRSRI